MGASGDGAALFGFSAQSYDVLCHLGLAIEWLAFLQSRVLWIRIVEILHALFFVAYSLTHGSPQYNFADCHFIWGIIIIVTNSYKIFVEV